MCCHVCCSVIPVQLGACSRSADARSVWGEAIERQSVACVRMETENENRSRRSKFELRSSRKDLGVGALSSRG
eukprot:15452323-Alexandrium_andersonii.AAC.1